MIKPKKIISKYSIKGKNLLKKYKSKINIPVIISIIMTVMTGAGGLYYDYKMSKIEKSYNNLMKKQDYYQEQQYIYNTDLMLKQTIENIDEYNNKISHTVKGITVLSEPSEISARKSIFDADYIFLNEKIKKIEFLKNKSIIILKMEDELLKRLQFIYFTSENKKEVIDFANKINPLFVYVQITENLNIRDFPNFNSDSKIIGYIKKGEFAIVIDVDNSYDSWYKIKYNGVVGYLYRPYTLKSTKNIF